MDLPYRGVRGLDWSWTLEYFGFERKWCIFVLRCHCSGDLGDYISHQYQSGGVLERVLTGYLRDETCLQIIFALLNVLKFCLSDLCEFLVNTLRSKVSVRESRISINAMSSQTAKF